jgi:hypothetical protein
MSSGTTRKRIRSASTSTKKKATSTTSSRQVKKTKKTSPKSSTKKANKSTTEKKSTRAVSDDEHDGDDENGDHDKDVKEVKEDNDDTLELAIQKQGELTSSISKCDDLLRRTFVRARLANRLEAFRTHNARSAFVIFTHQQRGSGICISPRGIILTCAHVLEDEVLY